MRGSMVTGTGMAEGMCGGAEYGRGPRMRERTGTILTMITTERAGRSMKVTGTMKTMATTTTGDTGNINMDQFQRPDRKIRPLCLPAGQSGSVLT